MEVQLYGAAVINVCLLKKSEHHLQAHQTAHKVVEVDSHVRLRVPSHQDLEYAIVQRETCLL